MHRIARLFGTNHAKTLRNDASRRKAARRRRPALDVLEERLALSAATVTLEVTNATDIVSNPMANSLRWAIEQANAEPSGTNVIIDFDIPVSYPDISLKSALPALTHPVTINGSSQPGLWGVTIDGTQMSQGDGLDVDAGASGSVIEGLSVVSFPGVGISLNGASNVTISNDQIGVNLAAGGSTEVAAPNQDGVVINGGSNNVINDDQIGANLYNGVELYNTSGNTVENTNFGADVNRLYDTGEGGAPLGNGAVTQAGSGIYVSDSSGNTIAGNLIVDSVYGIYLSGAGTYFNAVNNNTIGVNDAGQRLPNITGILIANEASYNTLTGNVIGGSDWDGVEISGAYTYENQLYGNWIGVTPGDVSIPNWNGVQLVGDSGYSFLYQNVIGDNYSDGVVLEQTDYNDLDDNWVGITSSGLWAGNGQCGIILIDGTSDNTIYADNVQDNGAVGIATYYGADENNQFYYNWSNNNGGGNYTWD